MIFITLVNIITVVLAYLAKFKNQRYLLACTFLLISLIFGIRYGYGNDFMSYKYFFDHGYSDGLYDDDVEPGWYLINQIFKPFGFSSMVFFLTVVEHLIIYDIIRKHVNPKWYWMAVFVYVFNPYYMLVGLSMMRQFFVQVLGLYAVNFLIRRKYLVFVCFVLFASLFHKVSILFLLLLTVPFVIYISKKPWGWLFIVTGLAGVILTIGTAMTWIIPMVSDLSSVYRSKYLNAAVLSEEYKIGLKTILFYVLYIALLFRNKNYFDNNERYYPFEVLYALLLLPLALMFPMASRVSWVFSFAEIVALPIIFYREKNQLIKIICLFIVLGLELLSFREFFYSEVYGAHFMIYKTILSN